MSEKKEKTPEESAEKSRVVAPQIKVSSPANKSSIDDLYRDNPNQEFAYAPAQSSKAALEGRGLVPVIGADGEKLVVGNRVICHVTGKQHMEEQVTAHQTATERFNETKDVNESQSADKTAQPRKPVKPKAK